MSVAKKNVVGLTSLSLLSLLKRSSESNFPFWSGTTRGILNINLGLGCSYSPIESKGSMPARAAGSLIARVCNTSTCRYDIRLTDWTASVRWRSGRIFIRAEPPHGGGSRDQSRGREVPPDASPNAFGSFRAKRGFSPLDTFQNKHCKWQKHMNV